VWRAYKGIIHCVFDQIPNLQNCFPTPKQKARRRGGFRQINTCRQVPLQVNFSEKPTFMIGVYKLFGPCLDLCVEGPGQRVSHLPQALLQVSHLYTKAPSWKNVDFTGNASCLRNFFFKLVTSVKSHLLTTNQQQKQLLLQISHRI
jgi:hypothetical protein